MVTGIGFTAAYIIYFKFIDPAANTRENWWFGISPEGIGALGMIFNFAVALLVCRFTRAAASPNSGTGGEHPDTACHRNGKPQLNTGRFRLP